MASTLSSEFKRYQTKMKKPAYALFVDLSAAFDHIIRDFMFNSILSRLPPNVNSKFIQLLQNLYIATTNSLAETPDDIFELFLGVRQGGPKSPILYNFYTLMARINRGARLFFLGF